MNFRTLQRRVERRERLLEARIERMHGAAASLKRTWRSAWTPGRIVIAGLVGGFVAGRAEPLRYAARSGDLVRLVSLLSGMFASTAAGAAAEAADEARHAADSAADATVGAVDAARAASGNGSEPGPEAGPSPRERTEQR